MPHNVVQHGILSILNLWPSWCELDLVNSEFVLMPALWNWECNSLPHKVVPYLQPTLVAGHANLSWNELADKTIQAVVVEAMLGTTPNLSAMSTIKGINRAAMVKWQR